MKKIILTLNMVALVALASCKNDPPPPPPPAPVPQVVTTPPTPPPAPEVPAKEEEKDGTTVSVGSDGVEVSTKNGDKKTVIDVKDGKRSIEIKK